MHNINKKNFEKIFSKNNVEFSDELKSQNDDLKFRQLKRDFLIADGALIIGLLLRIITGEPGIDIIFLLVGIVGRIYAVNNIAKFSDNRKLFIFFIVATLLSISINMRFVLNYYIVMIGFAIFYGIMWFLFYKEMSKICNQKLFYLPLVLFVIALFIQPLFGFILTILGYIIEFIVMLFVKKFSNQNCQTNENLSLREKLLNLIAEENLIINIFRILYFMAFVYFVLFCLSWFLMPEYRLLDFGHRTIKLHLKISAITLVAVYIMQIVILGKKNIGYCFEDLFGKIYKK